MSEREKVYQLLDTVRDSKISYLIGYIQRLTIDHEEIPNEETIAAMEELENGIAKIYCFYTCNSKKIISKK